MVPSMPRPACSPGNRHPRSRTGPSGKPTAPPWDDVTKRMKIFVLGVLERIGVRCPGMLFCNKPFR